MFLFTTHGLSSGPMMIVISLVTVVVHLVSVFCSTLFFCLKLPCITIYKHKLPWLKHSCSTRDLGPPCPSFLHLLFVDSCPQVPVCQEDHNNMLARYCSKSFKLGFNSTRNKKVQMCKLDLKRQRNQKSNYQHLLDHRKNKETAIKTFSVSLTMLIPLAMCITTKLWNILEYMGIPDHITCLLRSGRETADWFKIGKGVCWGYILLPC